MTKIYNQLKRDEGEILHAYQDHLGYWTIGVGTSFLQGVRVGMLSLHEALK